MHSKITPAAFSALLVLSFACSDNQSGGHIDRDADHGDTCVGVDCEPSLPCDPEAGPDDIDEDADPASNPEAAAFGGGDGSEEDPFRVCSWLQISYLSGTSTVWNRHFALFVDLEFDSNLPFAPIGSRFVPFTGSFDGQGHTIDGLTTEAAHDGEPTLLSPGGLFGSVEQATIENLTLTNPTVSGPHDVGALVGRAENNTLIRHITVTDATVLGLEPLGGAPPGSLGGIIGSAVDSTAEHLSVTATIENGYNLGGIVGSARDSTLRELRSEIAIDGLYQLGGIAGLIDGGEIWNAYTVGTIQNDSFFQDLGGLVGNSSATIRQSMADVDVTSTGQFVGGLVGRNSGEISDSYALGDVAGDSFVGGLVGYYPGVIPEIFLRNSYAFGAVTGDGAVGGLVGAFQQVTLIVEHSYWNSTAHADDNDIGEGLTADQFGEPEHFSIWDSEIWIVEPGERPRLSGE